MQSQDTKLPYKYYLLANTEMFSIDSTLIETYRLATLPSRCAMRMWMQHTGTLPIGILFYHRISENVLNPWTISPQAFRRQIEWLKANYEIVSLEQCQSRMVSGENRRPSVAITFDDGYAENCQWALPYLLEQNIPFTYFVTLGNVLSQSAFRHDIECNAPLSPNSIEQIRELADAGVEIGGHTRTHIDLGTVADPEVLADEVFGSMDEMSELIKKPIRYFAFPFGQLSNLNPVVFQMARERGLLGVCSAYGGFNFPGTDPFHLKRFHGDPSLARVKNWMTYDQRVLRSPDCNF